MIKFTTNQLAVMGETLNEIAKLSSNNLQKAERSFVAVQKSIQQLKTFILSYTFKNVEEEIRFFKEIKPLFVKEYIYHKEVFYIEANKPVGNTSNLISYYQLAMERIRLYFVRNQDFYNYYLTDKSDLDEQYFLRELDDALNSDAIEIDLRFCTIHSQKLAKLQAFELVNNYLLRCIYQIENPAMNASANSEHKFVNLWTDSKAALIELAYALNARGSVNNGKSDIKQIITDLEIIFNIEVGNFYRTFQNMRIRKKNITPFLDSLKESLERKMEQDY